MKLIHNGIEKEIVIRKRPLGDRIARWATPVARALRLNCIDKKTGKLKPESGCNKMKKRLNAGMSLTKAIKKRIKGE